MVAKKEKLGLRQDLIPRLPNEIGLEILARVPRRNHARSMMSVCPAWRAAIRSPSLFEERKRLQCTEAWIYTAVLCRKGNQGSTLSWFAAPATPHPGPSHTPEWLALPSMPAIHHTLHGFQTVVIGYLLYVIGGFQGCSPNSKYCQATNKVSVFNARTNQWSPVAEMAYPRGNFACGVIEGLLYVAGGETLLDSGSHDSSLHAAEDVEENRMTRKSAEVYDPVVGKWSCLPDMQYSKQLILGTTANGKLLVSGFYSHHYLQFEEIAEVYDPKENKWTIADPEFLVARNGNNGDEERAAKQEDAMEGRLPVPLIGRMASFQFTQHGTELFLVTDSLDIVRLKMGEKGEVSWEVSHNKHSKGPKSGSLLFCQIIAV
eukprot:c23178_g1_i1 orf=445-1566(+)